MAPGEPTATPSAEHPEKSTPPMDGVAPPPANPKPAQPAVSPAELKKAKNMLMTVGGFLYMVYILWCLLLLAAYPSSQPLLIQMQSFALMSIAGFIIAFIFIGLILLQRITKSDVSIATRQRSLFIAIAIIVPGILLGAVVPLMMLQPVPLSMTTAPNDPAEFIAPVSITFDLDSAVEILHRLGKNPVQYVWYTDTTGKPTDTTVAPKETVTYPRAGIYTVSAIIKMSDGSTRTVAKKILIGSEAFAVAPTQPIVERPAHFSVGQLFPNPKLITQVIWDFGDNTTPETTKASQIVHTFYSTGTFDVKVTINLSNQTQRTVQKKVIVIDPPPLPFPVALVTQPTNLMGPAPLSVLFTCQTSQPLRDVTWIFGDGKQDQGAKLTRIGHSYDSAGIYNVVLRARSESGSLAELTTIVKVTDPLVLPDLRFEGSPDVKTGNTITGDVPLVVSLKPTTTTPLIDFSWEAVPDEGDVLIDGTTFHGTYRTQGTYIVTLVAQDAEGKSMRLPLTIQANPPSIQPQISANPEGGSAPLLVTFDATDSFIPQGIDIAGYKWDFGESHIGQAQQITGPQVQYTYEKPGSYDVKVTIVTVDGKEYTNTRTILVRRPPLTACFQASRPTVHSGGGVGFDPQCSSGNPTKYHWKITPADQPLTTVAESDSTGSYLHYFSDPGDFKITLTVEDASGYNDSISKNLTVTP